MNFVSQRLVLQPLLFNIFVGDMDNEMEFALSRFADDTKQCGAVNMLKGCSSERPSQV